MACRHSVSVTVNRCPIRVAADGTLARYLASTTPSFVGEQVSGSPDLPQSLPGRRAQLGAHVGVASRDEEFGGVAQALEYVALAFDLLRGVGDRRVEDCAGERLDQADEVFQGVDPKPVEPALLPQGRRGGDRELGQRVEAGRLGG